MSPEKKTGEAKTIGGSFVAPKKEKQHDWVYGNDILLPL